jgi:hypothetical protein
VGKGLHSALRDAMLSLRSPNGRRDVSIWEHLFSVEYDLIRMAFDPNRRVPLFLRFGLISWLMEKYQLW